MTAGLDAAAASLAALMLAGEVSAERIAVELRRHGVARDPRTIEDVLSAAHRRVRSATANAEYHYVLRRA